VFGSLSSTVPLKTITSSFAINFCPLAGCFYWCYDIVFVYKNQVVFICLHGARLSDKISS
jgi:hypothetical protein